MDCNLFIDYCKILSIESMETSNQINPEQEVIQGYVECKAHGHQEPIPNSIKMWGEEADKVLRAAGMLAEDEHFSTGDCPICGSSLTINKNSEDPETDVISEHTELF